MSPDTGRRPRRSFWRWLADAIKEDIGWTPEARAQRERDGARRRAEVEARREQAVVSTAQAADGQASGPKPRGFVGRWFSRIANGTLVALGIACWIGVAVIHFPHVAAVRVDAVIRSTLTVADCNSDNPPPLLVRFPWHGHAVSEDDESQPCNRDYRPGDHLAIYVASNDPSDPGNDANWVLDPSSHDPFDFIPPNGAAIDLGLLGAFLLLCGTVKPALDWRRAARQRAARNTPA